MGKKKDKMWHDNEVRKMKYEKRDAMSEIKGDDYTSTNFDISKRKQIQSEFKIKRRSIKRS